MFSFDCNMFDGSLNFFAYVFLKSVAAFNISEAFDPDLNPLTFDR